MRGVSGQEVWGGVFAKVGSGAIHGGVKRMILKLNLTDVGKICATCKWHAGGTCKLNLETPVPVANVRRCKTWDQAYGASCVRA